MITTKDVGEPVAGKGPSKKLEPGNQQITIVDVKLQVNKFDKFKKDAEFLMLIMEGPDLGPNFEGFMRDKDDPSKGMHTGQVAWVKASEWAFADGTTKTGIEIKKNNEILRYIKSLCVQTDSMKWFDDQDGKHETINSFVEQFNEDRPFEGKKLNVCLAGNYYYKKDKQSEKKFLNCDLYLPKFTAKEIPFENPVVSTSKLTVFNEALHIKQPKEKDETATTSAAPKEKPDFDLD